MSGQMRLQTLSEARSIFAILVALMLVGWLFSNWLAFFFLLLIFYTFFFFRDPERVVPADPKAVVAAADGTIADIAEVEEGELLKTKARRIGIFLSVFDVHTNRAPVDGKVIYRSRREGAFFDARRPECSEKNEALTWGFENPQALIVVRQLTGAIARRIVAWAQVGDEVHKGDRFGMIRFGSRTEVYLPPAADVLVKVGDHVAGGSTIIARLP